MIADLLARREHAFQNKQRLNITQSLSKTQFFELCAISTFSSENTRNFPVKIELLRRTTAVIIRI